MKHQLTAAFRVTCGAVTDAAYERERSENDLGPNPAEGEGVFHPTAGGV